MFIFGEFLIYKEKSSRKIQMALLGLQLISPCVEIALSFITAKIDSSEIICTF
jgi:hypothetical protein